MSEQPYFLLQSLERAFTIFELFIRERRPLGITEIAKELKVHKSVIHRMIATMQQFQLLEQLPDSAKYQVGPKAFEFGSVYMNNNLITQGKHFLPELAEEVGGMVHLGILNQGTVLYLVTQDSPKSLRINAPVGVRAPVTVTALGKALTAWMEERKVAELLRQYGTPGYTAHSIRSIDAFQVELANVRAKGYAVDNEEQVEGFRCVAVPLRDYTGEVVAAISTAGTIRTITAENMEEIADTLKRYAAAISERLGFVAKSVF